MDKKIQLLLTIITICVLILSIFFILIQNSNEIQLKDNTYCEQLFDSAIQGGEYLVRSTGSNGEFIYQYNASSEKESSNYNMLRHAGTIYSMLQLYNFTKNKKLLNASEKAIEYLLSFVKKYNDTDCIVYEDEIKLGGNALTVIALAEYTKATGNNRYIGTMQNLSKYIQKSQKENGEFLSKRIYSSGNISDFVSQYYPGESLLALCRIYSLDKNSTWLDIAEKGAKYLINIRDKDISTYDLTHDHWLLMSLNELYRYRSDIIYLDHSIKIAESIMHKQRDGVNRISEYPEWIGSYYTPPRSTPTATRSEGLIAAYHFSKDFGNESTTDRILESINLGISFQLKTQFTKENNENIPNPNRANGGFRYSLDSYSIRIDYVQHNICSILGYYQIICNDN